MVVQLLYVCVREGERWEESENELVRECECVGACVCERERDQRANLTVIFVVFFADIANGCLLSYATVSSS